MSTKGDTMVETRRIAVTTAQRDYEVQVGYDNLCTLGAITRSKAKGDAAAIISDSNVAPLYAARVRASLEDEGMAVTEIVFEAGERNKRLSTLEVMLEELAEAGLTRADVVVALGGGVTGDMGGLAAAMYLRGIQVIQAPTSLLAMVDSSVGGKCAVDLAHGKNLAGAFFQPSAVVADVACLSTLSPELFRDSVGEVIKHAVLSDPALFEQLSRHPMVPGAYTPEELVATVARNVEIKRDVVDADATEQGVRQTLNLGHTLGHAIESANDYAWGHGTSVACGLACVTRATERLGWTEPGTLRAVERMIEAHGLPTDTEIDHDTIMSFATHDKKRAKGGVNLVVVRRIGEVELRHVSLDELAHIVEIGCGTKGRS